MAFKINNETKIGALTFICVALLIIGFNFLKGKSVFKSGHYLYAKYADTKALVASNPVYINGFQVGTVHDVETANNSVTELVVTIKLNKEYNIPDNSIAAINTNPLGTPSINITLGNSKNYLQDGATMRSAAAGGIMNEITSKIGPVTDQVTSTLHTLDSVLRNVNAILDPATKGNLQGVILNLQKATGLLVVTSASLQGMLSSESSALGKSLYNVSAFTKNLADNNAKITSVLSNLDSTTKKLSKADIDEVINSFKNSSAKLDSAMTKLNSTDGSLGALINDKQLFNNLNSMVYSLNILADDLRAHPKRYVGISIFGRKDKGNYLTAPLKNDSTNNFKK